LEYHYRTSGIIALAKKAADATDDNSLDSAVSVLSSDHEAGWDALATIRSTWYDKERLLVGRLADQYSQKSARSHVTDAHLSTLAWERQMRVCSQLPSGQVYNVSKKDEKAAALMNLVLSKYIMPGANSQFDLLTKLRMTGVYASTYGAQFVLYAYRIDDEYIGPDFWLIPARNIVFQPGRNNVQDCAWVDVITEENKSYFVDISKRTTTQWSKPNIKKLLAAVKTGAVPASNNKEDTKSAVERSRNQVGQPGGKTPKIELVTRYEKGKNGHWKTWAKDYPDAGVLRDIENPFKSGKIPIVGRYCFPLLDSIWGLGDFERGITMQKAKDSLINLYLEAVKMSIFPPLMIDVDQVTPSTIKMEAGARWFMQSMDAVQSFETSPMGVQEFTSTYQFMTTALLNQFGTTDTSSNAHQSGNAAFGKTPEALQQLQQRESARDAWDRYMLEKFIQELFEGMINLLATKQEKPINFHVFDKDMEEICEQFCVDDDDDKENDGAPTNPTMPVKKKTKPDPKLITTYDNRTAKVTVNKSDLVPDNKFVVDPSSTQKEDEEAQNESLTQILNLYMTAPQVWDQLLSQGSMKFDAAQAFKQFVQNSGVQDPDKIIVTTEDEDQPQLGPDGQPLQPAQPGVPGQPTQPAAGQPPSTPAMANQVLQSVQQGGDPTEAMNNLQQAAMYRDPQSMQAAAQLFPQGAQR
jgi:hypothetical protein